MLKMINLSIVVALVLSACSNDDKEKNTNSKIEKKVAFKEVSVPKTDSEKRAVRASSKLTLDNKEYDISYKTIMRSGDKVGDGTFGLIYNSKNQPVRTEDGAVRISNDNDFSSLLPVDNKLFMVSHFETRPAAMYLTELEQDSKGNLKAINTKNIDFSKFNGLWVPCAGSVTPWNTHLGSEEYEPDASRVKETGSIDDYYDQMAQYFDGDLKALNPYDYGWTPEVKVINTKGDVDVKKHYSMGRFAHELAYVMPDKKTVFLSDDGTNVGLFMFVADKAEDLSSGNLYAAKWLQISKEKAGSANLKWVDLGHTSNTEIKKALDAKIKFNDIFEVASPNNDICPSGFTSINTTMGRECLKIKTNMEKIASRLETRRYAAILGATTEFRKMEGISYNPNSNQVYLAMSEIAKGMENNSKKGKPSTQYDLGSNNDIKLDYNRCGSVYALDLTKDSKDIKNNKISSTFVPKNMSTLVHGIPDSSIEGNKCSVNSLANPDNITYIKNTNTLIIGEDTGSGHQNDYIWSYDIKNDKLTRIQTTPYGSETTSPYYYNNINGYGYLMSVVQHPYGEGDALTSYKDMPKLANDIKQKRAYTGYIGPLPVISK